MGLHSTILQFIFLITTTAVATDIKWTSNANTDEAATAPKSQRYWDEHNIERPDYAKTDAEIAEERGESTSLAAAFYYLVVLGLVIAAIVYGMDQWRLQYGLGSRLGGHQSKLKACLATVFSGLKSSEPSSQDQDQARSARLSRFDSPRAPKDLSEYELKED